jgi:hypothetical protein
MLKANQKMGAVVKDGSKFNNSEVIKMRLLMEQDMEQTQQENPELEPIKKFLLIQKLKELDYKLQQKNMINDSLRTFIDFAENLSFDTILTVSNSFIDFINQQLSQGIENAKQGQNAEG